MENKLSELEAKFDYYSQNTLRSLLTSKEIEDMATLSQESLQNIATIREILEQLELEAKHDTTE